MFNEVSMRSWMEEGWCSLSIQRERGMHSLQISSRSLFPSIPVTFKPPMNR